MTNETSPVAPSLTPSSGVPSSSHQGDPSSLGALRADLDAFRDEARQQAAALTQCINMLKELTKGKAVVSDDGDQRPVGPSNVTSSPSALRPRNLDRDLSDEREDHARRYYHTPREDFIPLSNDGEPPRRGIALEEDEGLRARVKQLESMIFNVPGVPPPLRRSSRTSYADSPFVDALASVEMPSKFSLPTF